MKKHKDPLDKNQDGKVNQDGTPEKVAMQPQFQATPSKHIDNTYIKTEPYKQFLYFSLLERRASYKAYQLWKVNKYELWFLCMIETVMLIDGKDRTSKNRVFDKITGNSKHKSKFEGYYIGLLNKGMIELTPYGNGYSIVISAIGSEVLKIFEGELIRLERHVREQAKGTKPTNRD